MKSRLRQALEWPIKHTAAFKRLGLLAPRGILLYGPPGERPTLPCCVVCQTSDFTAWRGLLLHNAATAITKNPVVILKHAARLTLTRRLRLTQTKAASHLKASTACCAMGVQSVGCAGCSKTRMAQAAAGSSAMRLQPLSGAQLFSMYVGEGEALLRDAFQHARLTAPAIIFIDEIDAIVGAAREATSNTPVHAVLLRRAGPTLGISRVLGMLW